MSQPPGRQQYRRPEWDVVCENLRGDPVVVKTWVQVVMGFPQVLLRVTEGGGHVLLPREAGAQLIVNINNAYDRLSAVNRGHGHVGTVWTAHCRRLDNTYVDVKVMLASAIGGPGVGLQVDGEDNLAVLSPHESGPRLLVNLKTAFRVQKGLMKRGAP